MYMSPLDISLCCMPFVGHGLCDGVRRRLSCIMLMLEKIAYCPAPEPGQRAVGAGCYLLERLIFIVLKIDRYAVFN